MSTNRRIDGALTKIDVGGYNAARGEHFVWGINAAQEIYRFNGTVFEQIPGAFVEIAAATDGTVWGINASEEIYRFDGTLFQKVPGALVKIAVGNQYTVWGINAARQLYRFDGTSFVEVSQKEFYGKDNTQFRIVPGPMTEIAAGSDGAVWGLNADEPNHHIIRFDGDKIQTIGGSLVKIVVGSSGNVWGINKNQESFRFNGTGFEQIAGALVEIAAASDGTVWGINASQEIYRFDGTLFQKVPGALVKISVGNYNSVWGLNASQQIFRFGEPSFRIASKRHQDGTEFTFVGREFTPNGQVTVSLHDEPGRNVGRQDLGTLTAKGDGTVNEFVHRTAYLSGRDPEDSKPFLVARDVATGDQVSKEILSSFWYT